MAHETSTSEWLLGGGGLVGIGMGVRWLLEWWGKRDERKQQRAERRSTKEFQKVRDLNNRLEQLEDKMSRLTIAVNILIAKEYRSDPNSPELQQVRAILGDVFPLHLHVPQDMTDKLGEIS